MPEPARKIAELIARAEAGDADANDMARLAEIARAGLPVIVRRNRRADLIRRFCARWYANESRRAAARNFLRDATRFGETAWRRNRGAASCPPVIRDAMQRDLWAIFTAAPPDTMPRSETTIREILSAAA